MLKLAREWFHCSAAELLERVTPGEIEEMYADYIIEPWGQLHSEQLTAYLAMHVTAPHMGSTAQPLRLEDFMLFNRPPERLPTEEELAAKIRAKFGH